MSVKESITFVDGVPPPIYIVFKEGQDVNWFIFVKLEHALNEIIPNFFNSKTKSILDMLDWKKYISVKLIHFPNGEKLEMSIFEWIANLWRLVKNDTDFIDFPINCVLKNIFANNIDTNYQKRCI